MYMGLSRPGDVVLWGVVHWRMAEYRILGAQYPCRLVFDMLGTTTTAVLLMADTMCLSGIRHGEFHRGQLAGGYLKILRMAEIGAASFLSRR